jgi:hypothetical protein
MLAILDVAVDARAAKRILREDLWLLLVLRPSWKLWPYKHRHSRTFGQDERVTLYLPVDFISHPLRITAFTYSAKPLL